MNMTDIDSVTDWPELLKQPAGGDHYVQVYQDETFLGQVVAEYVGTGLRRGDGVLIIATASHRAAFLRQLEDDALSPQDAIQRRQFILLDAEETLGKCTVG
jgi:DcmR-like sensory protein